MAAHPAGTDPKAEAPGIPGYLKSPPEDMAFRFNASNAVSFDEYLVCHRRRTKNAPRRTVIMKFFGEQVTANRNDMFKLLLGIFHFLACLCWNTAYFHSALQR